MATPSATPPPATSPPVLAPTPVPPTPAPPTATPAPDYAAMRQALLTPLGALIVSLRAGSDTLPAQSAAFESAAATVEPLIAEDLSANANRLHAVIGNTREALASRDLATLERQRLELLQVR